MPNFTSSLLTGTDSKKRLCHTRETSPRHYWQGLTHAACCQFVQGSCCVPVRLRPAPRYIAWCCRLSAGTVSSAASRWMPGRTIAHPNVTPTYNQGFYNYQVLIFYTANAFDYNEVVWIKYDNIYRYNKIPIIIKLHTGILVSWTCNLTYQIICVYNFMFTTACLVDFIIV